MTDLVVVAVIAAVPGSLAAALGIFNRFTLKEVKTNVDGNLIEIKNQLAIMTALHLQLTAEASKAQAAAQEKERARIAGDEKYAEGVRAEKTRSEAEAAKYAEGVKSVERAATAAPEFPATPV
jgi:hypothetical protein